MFTLAKVIQETFKFLFVYIYYVYQQLFVYIYLIKSLFHRYAQNVTNIEALPYPTTLPEFVPSHQSWAVTNALKDYAWTQKLLPSFVAIDMRLVPKKWPN